MFDAAAERLYPIVDTDMCRSRGLQPAAVAGAVFAAGARVIQLRMKSAGSAASLKIATELVNLARGCAGRVIVNDRADIARLARADGVHVGQDDLPPEAVRRVFPDAVVGISTHDPEQIEAALSSVADYIAVGPIFDTTTKATGYDARGLRLIGQACGRGKPVVAIGGITLERAPAVIAAGASAVAVITDILRETDVQAHVRRFLDQLG